MIEALQKRRVIRQFLNNYSEEQWKELIPDIFEIAILTLHKSFNKILFNKEELKDILEDLRNSDYYKTNQPKKIDMLTKHNINVDNKINTTQQQQQQNKPELIKKSYTNKQQPQIYPSWWHDDQENALKEEIENQAQFDTSHKKRNKRSHKGGYHGTNINKSKHKRMYETTPSNSEINSTYTNCTYTESEYSGKHNKKLVLNKLTKARSKNHYEPKNKITYKISYDKNLQPESIEQKSKDLQRSDNTAGDSNVKQSFKDRTYTPNSSRTNSYYDSYQGENYSQNKEEMNPQYKERIQQRSLKNEVKQYSNDQSRMSSHTQSLKESQEMNPQIMQNQRQLLGRQQIPLPHPAKTANTQNQYISNQIEEQNMYQQFPNQRMYRQQYTPNRQQQNQQFNYNPSYHQMQEQMMEQKLYQEVPSYPENQKIISQHSSINPHIENKQMQQQKYNISQYKITQDNVNNNQIHENNHQHIKQQVSNQIIEEQNYQPKLQMEENIEKKQIIQHNIHDVIKNPKEERGSLTEENLEQIKNKTYEILHNNDGVSRIKEELYQKNSLQQSNGSDIRHPGEQLSMIEVNEDLRSKFR